MLWKEKFSLGIEEIDLQHMHLVELIEHTKELLKEAEEGHDCFDETIRVLKELADYTVHHFTYEEAEMEKIDYDGLIAHRMEHKIFIKKISLYMSADLEDNQIQQLDEMCVFLLDWLIKHILETDTKYVSSMKIIS